VIYLDTSVVLAQLLAEDRKPPTSLWSEALVCSRLLEYETWTTINARRLTRSHGESTQLLLGHVSLIELSPLVLARALEPFPVPVRTLDALHLSTIWFLRERRVEVDLATYDDRLARTAKAMRIPLYPLGDSQAFPGRPTP
jgi:hypothetical protein